MNIKQSALDKAFAVTSFFEGGYCGIAGNDDDEILSIGFLQWNFGQGTLQNMFMRVFNEFPNVAESCLVEGGYWLKDAIVNGYEKNWGLQIQADNQVVDPWKTALYNLCCTQEFQQIQRDASQDYVDGAVRMCSEFGIYTDRAFSLFFDIAVQKGPNYKGYELAEPTYMEKLEAIATVAANTSNPRYVKDVLARKMSIVQGRDMSLEVGLNSCIGWSGVEFDDESAFEDVE